MQGLPDEALHVEQVPDHRGDLIHLGGIVQLRGREALPKMMIAFRADIRTVGNAASHSSPMSSVSGQCLLSAHLTTQTNHPPRTKSRLRPTASQNAPQSTVVDSGESASSG